MSYDGDKTYKSTDIMEVDGNLDVTARVYGLNGADWQLTVAATAGDSVACNKIFHRCIEKNQTDLLTKSIPLKQEK